MGKFNNIPGQSAPKGDIKNKFKPDDTEYKGTKVIPYDASKSGTAKPVIASTTPKNEVGNEITNVSPRKSVIGKNDVEGTTRAPSAMQSSKIGATTPPVTATTSPVAAKTAPVVKPTMKSAPTSKYRGGRSEEDINRMIAEATPDRMRASQFEKDNPDATPYKKGGMVKSGASRGDGCAQRGRTRGKYC